MSPRPSLLILSISNIFSDPRVLKQVDLFRSDYDLYTCGMGPKVDGVLEHFELPGDARGWTNDRLAILARRYEKAYWELPAVAAARAILPKDRFDIVLADDLNTVPLALSLNPRRGVHADLHEFAPREKDNDLRWRIFVAPFMRWICRKYLTRVGSATTVGQGIAREYEKDFGVKFGVVTNAAPYEDRSPQPVGSPIRLIHSGAAQRYRELENYIEAMRGAPAGVTLDMMLMPNEPAYLAELRERAADVPAVSFRDPVSYVELVDTVAQYDVSLSFLPPVNFNTANALPNKFFESVQARVGMIIGPSPEMAAILNEYGFGAIADDFSVAALRRVITALDATTVDGWKRAADSAAHDLSSENQVKGWASAIEKLAAG